MGSTNQLVDTITIFIELSPYRPSGTYVFSNGKGKLLVAKSPDAVVQLLIYSAQLSTEEERPEIALASLSDHLAYKTELEVSGNRRVYSFEKFQELPLNSEESADSEAETVNTTLDEFGLACSFNFDKVHRCFGNFIMHKTEQNSGVKLKYVDQLFMTLLQERQRIRRQPTKRRLMTGGIARRKPWRNQKFTELHERLEAWGIMIPSSCMNTRKIFLPT